MLEDELQAQVLDLVRIIGGPGALAYHTRDSRKSAPGFPDLVLLHERSGRLLAAELKRDGAHPTLEQRRWLQAWALRGEAHVWRPVDLRNGTIARVLQRWVRP